MKEEFSLTPIINPETKEYSVKNFNEIKLACEDFINENSIDKIENNDDLKKLRKFRTNIRKKSETIKNSRLALVRIFSFQFKELEAMLDAKDNDLKKIKDAYELSQEIKEIDSDTKKVTLVIEYRDDNVIKQITKMAVEKGCTVTEIGGKK